MAFCPSCGAQIPAGATACPACAGGSATPPAGVSAAAPAAGLTDNVAGMLAYITIIPAIVFLVLEPYNKRRFIRFHSFQCIFLTVAYIVLAIVLSIFTMIPGLGLIMLPVHFLIWIGALVLWIILLMKAYQGQMFKLPVIGDMAEKQADAA
jgi:uncharacterized membrane protein